MNNISSRKKYLKRTLYLILISIIGLNVIACFHAYKFTHFVDSNEEKTKKELTSVEKLKVLLFGVNNPRPKNKKLPKRDYSTFYVESNVKIECWKFNVINSKGTIVLFHGYGGEKSSLLDKSEVFNEFGYNTVLVDFSGSGGSEGNRTTIGYLESMQVLDVFNQLKSEGVDEIYLFGTSMGAVAIMKAMADNKINPIGLILECERAFCYLFYFLN
jgi:dipeptidyl aminopeptidase/acylaminoacyl peptidase